MFTRVSQNQATPKDPAKAGLTGQAKTIYAFVDASNVWNAIKSAKRSIFFRRKTIFLTN